MTMSRVIESSGSSEDRKSAGRGSIGWILTEKQREPGKNTKALWFPMSSRDSSNSEESESDMSSPSTDAGEGSWLDDRALRAVLHDQREMLAKLEKANETLETCNSLSHQRIEAYAPDFRQHVKLILDMKKDLESVYRRLRIIKAKVAKCYPVDYADAVSKFDMKEDNEDDQV